MEIVFDIAPIIDIASSSTPIYLMWYFFINGGWIPVLYVLLFGFSMIWLNSRQDLYYSKWKFVLLAIDIPKINEQSPKAVEQIFAALAGAHSSANFKERWWDGKIQESFGLEIISIEGYVQFLVYTEVKFRDLVEAAIYSQYPDAEITEVEDYTEGYPEKFPDDVYDIWGSEFIYVKNQAYPLRTYPKFEHQLSGEFKDPMAAFLEVMAKIGKGEQIWFQILIKPILDDWKNDAIKVVYKLAGKAIKSKPHFGFLGQEVDAWWEELTGQITGFFSGPKPLTKTKDELPSLMLHLTPGEKTILEGIEEKVAKIGFDTKIRMVYVARREVMKKSLAVNGMVGSLKQYNTINLNSLKPDTKVTATRAQYAFATWRLNQKKERIMKAYRLRSMWRGRIPKVFNIEELATLYHFPVSTGRITMVQTIQAKKAAPGPILPESVETLPSGLTVLEEIPEAFPENQSAEQKSDQEPPENLPTIP